MIKAAIIHPNSAEVRRIHDYLVDCGLMFKWRLNEWLDCSTTLQIYEDNVVCTWPHSQNLFGHEVVDTNYDKGWTEQDLLNFILLCIYWEEPK